MVSSSLTYMKGLKVAVADPFTVSALQLPVTTAGPLTGHLHKHLCPRNLPEDNGQEP